MRAPGLQIIVPEIILYDHPQLVKQSWIDESREPLWKTGPVMAYVIP